MAAEAPGRRRYWLALVALVGALGLFTGVLRTFGKAWIVGALVTAPNAGIVIRAEDDPDPARLAALEVDRQLRFDVGPPPASIALWVLEPHPPAAPRGTVLVLHGIRSEKYWMLGLGKVFARAGYRVVLVDLRGHGRSSGDHLTYGVVDARDLSQVLDGLAARGLLAGRVGVVGASYGAATAIELAGADERVAAVIAIAPFSSLHDVVPGYVARYLPGFSRLLPPGFVDEGIAEAGRRGGFDPRAASPLAAITRTRARVLLIHGRADSHIPFAHSERLHDAAPDRAQLVLVSGEDHNSIMGDRTRAIAGAGVDWFHRYLDAAGP